VERNKLNPANVPSIVATQVAVGLSKAFFLKKKYVRAYKIDDKTIEKFIISKQKGKEWTTE